MWTPKTLKIIKFPLLNLRTQNFFLINLSGLYSMNTLEKQKQTE